MSQSEAPDAPVGNTPAESPGRPGRYDRSFGGLMAAMIVTVVAVVAFVALRGFVFGEPEGFEPEEIDYVTSVAEVQTSGDTVVYPASLPPGWIVTNFDIDRGTRPAYGFALLTEQEKFVGIRQADESVEDLLTELVAEDPVVKDRTYDASASVAPTWRTYSADGGDLAYVAQVEGETVMVYGSAGAAALEAVVESLTTEPLPR